MHDRLSKTGEAHGGSRSKLRGPNQGWFSRDISTGKPVCVKEKQESTEGQHASAKKTYKGNKASVKGNQVPAAEYQAFVTS